MFSFWEKLWAAILVNNSKKDSRKRFSRRMVLVLMVAAKINIVCMRWQYYFVVARTFTRQLLIMNVNGYFVPGCNTA